MWVQLTGASYVKAVINTTGASGRFSAEVNGVETSSFYVGLEPATTEYMLAGRLAGNSVIRLINVLEPAFTGANTDVTFTFVGWKTDGTVSATPKPIRTRRIELVGDSISAGYGSRGNAKLHAQNVCPVSDATSGNKYTYNWQIAEHFNADIVPIAWSGKGMYQNCCDMGETMPAYYKQTLAGQAYINDWDFTRYVPDMLIINLGTNDFGHDSGPTWEAGFSKTYTEFVLNATQLHYKDPKMPVFVAQGPMNNSPQLWAALNVTIAAINAAGGNAVYLDLKGPPNDGCGGHPGVLGHSAMSAMAIPQIAAKMGWDAHSMH